MTLEPGQILDGKYRIVRLLGAGGMGSVYEGENNRIHRRVAIKVLHAGVAAKADVVQRFEREAQAAGRIGSEHIVEVLDLGSLADGERYMVMEFLEGESFGDRIKKRKRLEPREVAPVAHQLLEGLAAAHDAGIIHRDLKPDNVYLLVNKGGQRDFVKLLDFGVSKFSALEQDSMSMTRTGAVMGTPYYMSPEQARGAKIDPRSDLYSVGVILYQAVTGRVPFNAETFNELVFKIALEAPHPAELVTPGLDPGFATIIAKAMTRDAAMRFQSAREFQAAIGSWIQTGAGVSAGTGAVPSGLGGPPQQQGGGTMALPQSAFMPPNQQQQQQQYGAGQGYPQNFGHTPHGHTPHGGVPVQSGLGVSGPSFNQAGPMGQSSPHLGMSQAGLAMTGPQPRGSGMMIAIGLLGTVLLAGGAFGAYKVLGSRGAAVAPRTTATTATTTSVATVAPPATAEAPATATPASTAAATATPGTTEVPAPTAAPVAVTAPTSATVRQPITKQPPPPPPAPTAKKPSPPAVTPTKPGGGRVIGGEL